MRKFSKEVAISDSCYTSELGDNFYTAVRGLHEAAGMKTVELANNRQNSLCCGFASGIRNNYHQTQVPTEAKKKQEAKSQLIAQIFEKAAVDPGLMTRKYVLEAKKVKEQMGGLRLRSSSYDVNASGKPKWLYNNSLSFLLLRGIYKD